MDIGQLDELMQHLKSKGIEFTTLKQLEEDFPKHNLVGLISALRKDGYLNEGQETYFNKDLATGEITPVEEGRKVDGIYKLSYRGLMAMEPLFCRWLMNTPYRKADS